MSNIHKVWGERRRILLTDGCEIDLLYIKKNAFCSYHYHKNKINKFVVVSGKVEIETAFGKTSLKPNESWEVHPPLSHRFKALKNSVMIELAYVTKSKINPKDIIRHSQGGRIIGGKEYTLNQILEKNRRKK